MNWGYRIIVVYVMFISGIVYMVVRASAQKTDLVRTDYYEEELKYQQTIDATENANALTAKLKCEVQRDTMFIYFPAEMKKANITSTLWLYCIADKNNDIKKTAGTSNGEIALPLTATNKGMHDVKVNWTVEGKQYYFEEKIRL